MWTFKKCNKKVGSPCLFTRQQALKMGYFYCFLVKNSNHLHIELSLGYFKDTKFYFENKASFIYICSNASFTPTLIPWLWEYCTFWDSSVVSLKSSPWVKYTPVRNCFPKKIHVLLSNFFSSLDMFFIRLFLANTWKKKSGVTVLVWEKRSIYFAIGFSLSEISYVLYAHVLMCAR